MQEQEIHRLEHHVAQLSQSLKAGGLISQAVTSSDGVPTGEGEKGAENVEKKEADGDLP